MRQSLATLDVYEAEVNARFDLLHDRFKRVVDDSDVRLDALLRVLHPIVGHRILDLGCGKGRFAAKLASRGAQVVGLDLSAAMLAEAESNGVDRLRASARRLPFASNSFDAVIAVEVFEHLASIDRVLEEARRVLKPGGVLAVIDKNAGSWYARRPWLPNLIVKWVDEKRGRWMYPSDGPVKERWFWPCSFRVRLAKSFVDVRVEYLLTPEEEAGWLFQRLPSARLMTLWSARAPGEERS